MSKPKDTSTDPQHTPTAEVTADSRHETNAKPSPESYGESRPYTFDRVVRLVITVLSIAAAYWLISTLKSVLLPFLVAWLIAYILEPFVQSNKRLLGVHNRWLPIFVTLFECLLFIIAIGVFIVPSVIEEMHQVAVLIREYAISDNQTPLLPDSVHRWIMSNIDFETISSKLTSQDIRSIVQTIGSFIAGGYNLVLDIFNWFIVILYVVFIMLDYDRLRLGVKRMVPPKYRAATYKMGNDVKLSMNHYFRGQALVASIVGILFCIGFSIIGLPLAVVMGLFIGLLNMVPYLQLISLVPTTLLCLVYSADTSVDFWHIWVLMIIVYIVVQCIQDLFLTPKIMGKAMGLNPALILLSLSVWGTLLGFIGLIIALPLTTLLLAYYERYLSIREDPDDHPRDTTLLEEIIEDPTEQE
ncbi:MAG: AI-2E family transporter [Muribaculaceae bacterium]|nr:AI-2E family transporter [Muribaculaceae bacterium]